VLGRRHSFSGASTGSKGVIQAIVLDIYSKIWITYRSKFPPLLSSRYSSDAGWGCMIRTTQMMMATALTVVLFDYQWTLSDLHGDDEQSKRRLSLYYDSILASFNDVDSAPFSIHRMLRFGAKLYDKPIGHWFGPNETCFMIKHCIEASKRWRGRIDCIVSDSGTIYKSDVGRWPNIKRAPSFSCRCASGWMR